MFCEHAVTSHVVTSHIDLWKHLKTNLPQASHDTY